MKKISTLLLSAMALAFSAMAQPTLTESGVSPVIGNVFSYAQNVGGTPFPQGNAGANQTWDFTSFTGSAGSGSFVTPSSTPYASSYPSANLAVAGYEYFKTSSTKYEFFGTYQDADTHLIYTNSEEQLHYPFTYNNTYSDTWAADGVSQGTPFERTGTTTVTADGYGTLKTPAATYNNALRVHFLQVYHDDLGVSYVNDEYFWYVPNIHFYVADVYTLNETFDAVPGDTIHLYATGYLASGATGITSVQTPLQNINLFPNPAAASSTLVFNAAQNENVTVEVTNVLGQIVTAPQALQVQTGRNEITLSTDELAAGIYMVMTRNKEGILLDSRRLVVKH